MKTKMKKYPLWISLAVSCALIVASIFVLAFCGMKVGTSLGGGSQFEINVPQVSYNTKEMVSDVKAVLKDEGLTFDSSSVQYKPVAVDVDGTSTKDMLVVKITESNISDEKEAAVVQAIAEKLQIPATYVSSIENITALTTGNSVLKLGIAIAIIAAALFVFAWVRYDVIAGLTFIISFLHNIIVYLALVIVTRIELNLAAIVATFILTLVMNVVLIHIFEKYRVESRLHVADGRTISEKMIDSEKSAIKPFLILLVAFLVAVIMMLFVPATVVKFIALNIIVALVVTAYTTIIVAPASYVAISEFIYVKKKAVLSRNDTVNKAIKKKIKKSKAKAAKKLEETTVEEKTEVKEEKIEEKKPVAKKSTTKKSSTKKSSKK